MSSQQSRDALNYHSAAPRGKLQVIPTKPMATQQDLALAYSPGVAIPCEEIAADPSKAQDYTMRGNLVAVITNGTAVLGLGNIGPLASKPVMEGKAALFKKFSGIDVFDLEVAETDVDAFCKVVAALEPTFGGVNLEDIKAPECFEIEKRLRKEMGIPVFHDDQHGTAIVSAAAVLNALTLVDKKIEDVRIVANGAGAASLACLDLLVSLGASRENILVCDRRGVIYKGRGEGMDPYKERFANETDARDLAGAMKGADVFLGLSAGKAVSAEMAASMAPKPLIMAMANPEPEIRPELVASVRDDAICATGRSDYPNQVNNVLCFPFIFRGALDCGATEINEEMKKACAKAIADMARAEASDVVLLAYGAENMNFSPEYIIPKPFDPRLIMEIAPAVAQAAMDSGVATRPIEDMEAYREQLSLFVYQSGMLMKPVFEKAERDPKRVVYAEGDSIRVLHTAQQAVSAGIARPVLLGKAAEIKDTVTSLGLSLNLDKDVEIVDPDQIDLAPYAELVHDRIGRDGIAPKEALRWVRNDPTVLAFCMLERGEVDAAICGANGRFGHHLTQFEGLIGLGEGVSDFSTLNALVLPGGTVFIADTYVTPDPTAEELAELTVLATQKMRNMGLEPKVALLSHSNFGDRPTESSRKMRRATEILRKMNVDFEFDGEMHADVALTERLRKVVMPDSLLTGAANLLVMPNVDAAHISLNLMKTLGGGVSVGPIMLGAAKPAHIVSQSSTVRGLLNMTAVAVVDAKAET
ncbi:NADP-dependent malic enzyme [Thalassococcus sp. BH17M4-6]|uniref:NADP-dependent malic enzyme n=1 Tax=Thalassococcus sp. BH17M4-6 TaxID=3413148 RepID=UPI003BD431C3